MPCSVIKTVLKVLFIFGYLWHINRQLNEVVLKHLGKGTLYFSVLDALSLIPVQSGDTLDGSPKQYRL